MKHFLKVLAVIITLAVPAFSFASVWSIDPDHSSVTFKVRHMMVSNVKGEFTSFSGSADIDDEDIKKMKVEVAIDPASLGTGVEKRDEHLKGPDFLDVAKYPAMAFVSKQVVQVGDDKLRVYGDLTMHGVTKEVVLNVEGPTKQIKDPRGNLRRGVSAVTQIDRKDFGMTWNAQMDNGGVVVGDEVIISLEIELLKK